jgi:hypothetical protein
MPSYDIWLYLYVRSINTIFIRGSYQHAQVKSGTVFKVIAQQDQEKSIAQSEVKLYTSATSSPSYSCQIFCRRI